MDYRDALKKAAAKQKLRGPVEPSSLERELALRRLELEFELEVKKMESERRKLEMEKQKAMESERLEKEKSISAGAPPQTPLGSLQRSPDPLAGFKAAYF